MTTPSLMPAAFVGHGSPMNTLEHNRFTEAWSALAASIPRPAAVLAISAHWYTDGTGVTAMDAPRTIHDFGGFPDALYAVQYQAPGSPALAARVAELLAPHPVNLDRSDWGLDHGSWSILHHMYPAADVPVVQLSIDARLSAAEHVELGRRLAPLRREGVLVLGSGNVVHNLGRIRWQAGDVGEGWADAFDREATRLMTTTPGAAADLVDHVDYRLAAPTPDHLIPLYYVAGVADAEGLVADVLIDSRTLGSLSMTSYSVG